MTFGLRPFVTTEQPPKEMEDGKELKSCIENPEKKGTASLTLLKEKRLQKKPFPLHVLSSSGSTTGIAQVYLFLRSYICLKYHASKP